MLAKKNSWAKCRYAFALAGLERKHRGCEGLNCIRSAECRHPKTIPGFTQCLEHDVGLAFNRRGETSCPRDYYMAGIHKGGWFVIPFVFNL